MSMKVFFDTVRPLFRGGRLDASQVKALEFLVEGFQKRKVPNSYAAYLLATVLVETDWTMEPITEYGPREYFSKYDRLPLSRALGNVYPGDGYLYRGRGYVMITGRSNYTRAALALDKALLTRPELANDPEIALDILVRGSSEGWFTGRKLADYLDRTSPDWINSRRIINGTDRAEEIAGYAKVFYRALDAAAAEVVPPPPSPFPASDLGPALDLARAASAALEKLVELLDRAHIAAQTRR